MSLIPQMYFKVLLLLLLLGLVWFGISKRAPIAIHSTNVNE